MAKRKFFERLRGRFARDKVDFWKPRAIKALNEIDWQTLYGDDGAPDRVRLSDEEYDDMEVGYNPITPERVLALAEDKYDRNGNLIRKGIGYDQLTAAIREKIYMQDLYWNGDTDKATNRWLHRRDDLPDWFYWYHGYTSA